MPVCARAAPVVSRHGPLTPALVSVACRAASHCIPAPHFLASALSLARRRAESGDLMARKPNLAVQLTCVICEGAFHPYRGREATQRVCSHRCASMLGTRALQAKRVQRAPQRATQRQTGKQWNTGHQGNAASALKSARRISPALSTSYRGGITVPAVAAHPLADVQAREQEMAEAGQEWLASGIRFERLTTELGKPEPSSRTL